MTAFTTHINLTKNLLIGALWYSRLILQLVYYSDKGRGIESRHLPIFYLKKEPGTRLDNCQFGRTAILEVITLKCKYAIAIKSQITFNDHGYDFELKFIAIKGIV